MSVAERGEFKGNHMIVLRKNKDDKYPFQFGVQKAKLILESIEYIKRFVEEETGQSTADDGDI